MKSFQLFLLLCCCSHFSFAQYTLSGKITDEGTQDPLSFVHLILNNGQRELHADINGNFSISSDVPIRQLTAKHPLYRTVRFNFSATEPQTKADFSMRKIKIFQYVKETGSSSRVLMEKVFANKEQYNPHNFENFSYQSYNKFTLQYNNIGQIKSLINKVLSKFKKVEQRLDSTLTEQHLFMMESVTGRDYYDSEHHLETVEAAKVSGIEKPTIFALTSQLQPLSIYEKEPYLLGKHYFGPFGASPFKWYRFNIVDTAFVASDTIYTVQFNPKSLSRIQFLKGYLYINSNGYTVNYHHASPAIEPSMTTEYITSYAIDSSGQWMPHRIKTGIIKEQITAKNARLEAIDETVIHKIQHDVGLSKRDFSELSLTYKSDENKPNSYWDTHRKIPFSRKDSLTYSFYDSVGSLRNFERFIRLGEGLMYGELPYKNIDLLLNRVLDFNQFEGIRLGLGMQTNERFWKVASFGGYFGYGFNDNQWKYGLFSTINLNKTRKTQLHISHLEDLWEAADPEFSFDEPQFKSEALRRYRVLIKDKIIRNEAALRFRPFKFLQVQAGILQDKITPQYEYQFTAQPDNIYRFGEIRVGVRYAYGEHFMESVHRRISFGTEWPILWVQLAKGYKGFLDGEFDYLKIDAKLQNSIRLIGWGTSHFQVRVGYVQGTVPYSRLYNGTGSFRTLAAIARNSFETMGYNEFLSDKHFSFFFSHDFGDLHIRKLNKQPSFEMSHNFGFGSLDNPDAHQIGFKTMERGFFESGVFMNNILVISLPGISAGLGAGAFTRYGPYAFSKTSKNTVFKLALEFQL